MTKEQIEKLRTLYNEGYAFRIKGSENEVLRSKNMETLCRQEKDRIGIEGLESIPVENVIVYKNVSEVLRLI